MPEQRDESNDGKNENEHPRRLEQRKSGADPLCQSAVEDGPIDDDEVEDIDE